MQGLADGEACCHADHFAERRAWVDGRGEVRRACCHLDDEYALADQVGGAGRHEMDTDHGVCLAVDDELCEAGAYLNGHGPAGRREWEPNEIDMAVPLSPKEVLLKRNAVFKHESQKDRALFPGPDLREFWQRAEDRNKGTAESYNQIGLPEYYALEAFVRWDGDPI